MIAFMDAYLPVLVILKGEVFSFLQVHQHKHLHYPILVQNVHIKREILHS